MFFEGNEPVKGKDAYGLGPVVILLFLIVSLVSSEVQKGLQVFQPISWT